MAPEAADLAISHLKREFAARVSAFADLQGVMSRCNWRLDRVTIRFNRPDAFTVDQDIVRATARISMTGAFRVSLRVADIFALRLLGLGLFPSLQGEAVVNAERATEFLAFASNSENLEPRHLDIVVALGYDRYS